MSEVYIDGSCLDNKNRMFIGFACYFGDDDDRNYSGNRINGTNNIAELLALKYALIRQGSGDITIYCDSAYVILIFKKITNNIDKGIICNKEIIEDIKDIINNYKGNIEIIKVKSHSGIHGNEVVDIMAKKAAYEVKYK